MSLNGASSNIGGTSESVGDFTTLLFDVNPNLTPTGYPTTFTKFDAPISGVASPTTGRIAFRYFIPANAGSQGVNGNYIGVDTFSVVDNPIPPIVNSITRANPTPTSASTVNFTVLFSEPVTGVDLADFVLSNTGSITGATITNVSGSNSNYTVTASTGSGVGTIRLDLIDDDSIRDANNLPLNDSGLGNGNFTTGETYTIEPPPPTVQLSITTAPSNGNASETDTTAITVTATTSAPVSGDQTLAVVLSGTATANDFTGTIPAQITIANGQTAGSFTINVNDDAIIESTETATFTISNPSSGISLGAATTGSVTITDNDSSLAIAANPSATATEGDSGTKAFTFTVTRSGNISGSSTADWTVTGTGANPANATDFGGTLPTGTVNFAANETSKVITVNVSGDTTIEPDENFTVTLANPSGASITNAIATGTIQNDDAALAIATDPSATATEGNSGTKAFTFTVTRSGNTSGSSTAAWSVTGAGANPANATDFGGTLPTGTVSFAANETSKTITVNVNGDTTVEPDENFTVTLANPSAGTAITTASATGTIQNDDVTGTSGFVITAANATQSEGNTGYKNFSFTVSRDTNINDFSLVNYAVSGSGTNPANVDDFGGFFPSGNLSFFAGQTSQTLNIQVRGDIANELDENFTVTLISASGGAAIAVPTATGTIQNDDTLPTFAIAATNASQTEGNTGNKAFTFTVTRTGDTTGANNVNWAVSSSGLNLADAIDFGSALPSGTLAFTAGQTSQVITVNVKGDAIVEPDENFTITLSNATNGALIGADTAVGTIINDDIIVGTAINDSLTGSAGNDTISGLAGLDTLPGLAGNDSLTGGLGNDFLTGGLGNDTLLGDSDSDTLNGVDPTSGFGLNEIDRLTGGAGSDRFVLADSTRTYYLGNGSADYALITDFSAGDTIQTRIGNALTIGGALPTGITSGTAVYLGADLVAVVQGSVPTATAFVAV